MTTDPTLFLLPEQIEEHIRETFELNYQRLKLEGGHALSSDIKNAALEQILGYYRKMRDVAERVTDTEVRLTLPEQVTAKGRKYTIEGVVDIVRDDDETIMYDIKTHDADYVEKNVELYEKQLNVYAHIWQTLRGEPLDQTAIIATAFPPRLVDAQRSGNQAAIDKEMAEWNPLIEIDLDQTKVASTIQDFGEVVDAIEEKRFRPPRVEALKEKIGRTRWTFGVRICRNCDARFSCQSYRNYSASSNAGTAFDFKKYLDEYGGDDERTERTMLTLEDGNL